MIASPRTGFFNKLACSVRAFMNGPLMKRTEIEVFVTFVTIFEAVKTNPVSNFIYS